MSNAALLAQLNADLASAYDENEEEFVREDTSTFSGMFTLDAADLTDELSDRATGHSAELRVVDSITLSDEDLLTRSSDGTKWIVQGAAESDGFGENIVQLQRTTRDRIGGR